MEAEQVFDNPKSLLIKNARLFDGTGKPPQDAQSISIINGEIKGIGPDIPGNGLRELDVAGATVMPGIIDACVHLKNVPGAVYRQDSEAKLRELRYQHLRGYLACGVTTVLDNSISAPLLREFQEYLASGGPGPRVYALAPAFPPIHYSHSSRRLAPIALHISGKKYEEEIISLFTEYDSLNNIVGTLILILRDGPNPFNLQIFSKNILDVILRESLNRNLPVYISTNSNNNIFTSLEMDAHNLRGAPWPKKGLTEQTIDRIKNSGTYTTSGLIDIAMMTSEYFFGKMIDSDNLLKLAVPKEELLTAMDRKAWDEMYISGIKCTPYKWIPTFILRGILPVMYNNSALLSFFQNSRQIIMNMYNAGITIALGSESSSGPLFPASFHGPNTICEMEILSAAGMRPMDVLLSATKIPAEMMGLADLIGSVEVGKRADLIVMRDDPLRDLGALRNLTWVIKDGQARTPAGWMQEAA